MKRINWILLSCALLLAGCAQPAALPCAGWERPPKIRNPAYLVREEPLLARWLAATDRFGKNRRCWK